MTPLKQAVERLQNYFNVGWCDKDGNGLVCDFTKASCEEIEAVLAPFFPKQPKPELPVDYQNMKEPKDSVINWIKWYRYRNPGCDLATAHKLAKKKSWFK